MFVLTHAERRLAALVALLLALGTAHDLWQRHAFLRAHPGVARDSLVTDSSRVGDRAPGSEAPDAAAAAPVASESPQADAPERPGVSERVPTLDLNHATAEELDALPGIGPVLARRIVAHRENHGPFRDVRDIGAVTGIGPRLFARIRPYLRVNTPAAPP